MTVWIIEPRDPLIVRDGKPFGPNPGARATTLSFPFPSTTTGGVRTRAGQNANGTFSVPTNQLNELKKLKVRGPLLAELTEDAEISSWLVPAPADVVIFEHKQDDKQGILKQLLPIKLPEGALTDFNQPVLVGLKNPDSEQGKPHKKAPRYWKWNIFQDWLLNPSQMAEQITKLSTLGHNGPGTERRSHVSIDPDTGAAIDGALFETSGLEFSHTDAEQTRLVKTQRLALTVEVDNLEQVQEQLSSLEIREGFAQFGGERRTVLWHKSNKGFPECPKELVDAIVEQKACRVLLLTPAHFEDGYHPRWLEATREGVTPTIQASAIQRPQVVSGWDFEKKGPKPSRRLAPAGSVFFLSLQGDDAAIRRWIADTWMQCVSDFSQDRDDGFGLAVVGTWSGKAETMEL